MWFTEKWSANINFSCQLSLVSGDFLWSCLRMQLSCSDTSSWWIHTGSTFWSCRELQRRGRSEGLFSATVPSGREPHYGPSPCPQAPQHPPPHPPPAAPADCDASCSAASIRPGGHVRGTKADCHHTQTKSKSEFLSAVPSWLSRLACSRALRSIINVFFFLGCIKSCAWMHRFCFVCFLFCRVFQVWLKFKIGNNLQIWQIRSLEGFSFDVLKPCILNYCKSSHWEIIIRK